MAALSTMVRSMIESKRSWDVIAAFREDVMSQKEAAEVEREAVASGAKRHRRTGRIRRACTHYLNRGLGRRTRGSSPSMARPLDAVRGIYTHHSS